jgi:hypothetical protein
MPEPSLKLFGLFPPFDSICALTCLTLIALAVVLSSKRKEPVSAAAPHRPMPWGWIGAGLVCFVLLYVVLLLFGLWFDPVEPLPYAGGK